MKGYLAKDIIIRVTYLRCHKHCHRPDRGIGHNFGRILEPQIDEADCFHLPGYGPGVALPSVHEIKVGGSVVEGRKEEERICHSVGHPYAGQRTLSSICFYRKASAGHRSDCHGSVCQWLHACRVTNVQGKSAKEAHNGSKVSHCVDGLLHSAKRRMDRYHHLQVAVWDSSGL